ncbi:MAG: YbaK/EbsC family protein [Cellulomonas sp.]|uniref:YbaK/EbsC family protein n=1 Tax=Cellulomonas sp. 73-92 TaxID=1895740 RepID=UPI00092B2651|nr:YbaK/EbsC family protein [Cellulomonas sp. 73-92]MBN9375946.1 YbaK/EbsC family protein [Cellulomonas sp.]OJV80929.1 MAG: EBSC protein [Cellulomonas sp. 73-92]
MSLETARAHLASYGRADDVIETARSSATVELAAAALGVEPRRIAKTLSFRGASPETAILVITAGDARVDNAAFKAAFGLKARMLVADEVLRLTGHEPGGVCPFGNPPAATVYLDTSLQRFDTVFPACGSAASAIELTCEELRVLGRAHGWVAVTTIPS